MRTSGITVADVKDSFTGELSKADAGYYYDSALDWSNGADKMKTDWVATIRNFARGDLRDGKLKISVHIQDGGTNKGEKIEIKPVSKSAMTYEEYKRNKKLN